MTTLESQLNTILEEKVEKIIPENIKEGIIIFGVEGINTGPQFYSTVEEMQAETYHPLGTMALVIGVDFDEAYTWTGEEWRSLHDLHFGDQIFDVLNQVIHTKETYTEAGGTDDEISKLLDQILGKEVA